MTLAHDPLLRPLDGLPDPELDRQFYEGVPTRRFIAWTVDVLVVLAFSAVVVPVFGILTLGLGFLAAPFMVAAIGYLYRTATIASRSATWGMRLMGVELRRADGRRFDLTHAAVHVALYAVTVAFPVLLLGHLLTVPGTRYRQALHDFALGTTAINCPED